MYELEIFLNGVIVFGALALLVSLLRCYKKFLPGAFRDLILWILLVVAEFLFIPLLNLLQMLSKTNVLPLTEEYFDTIKILIPMVLLICLMQLVLKIYEFSKTYGFAETGEILKKKRVS